MPLMQEGAPKQYTKTSEVVLPQSIIDSYARFLIPEIKKYYESEQGQKEYEEWKARQEDKAK